MLDCKIISPEGAGGWTNPARVFFCICYCEIGMGLVGVWTDSLL